MRPSNSKPRRKRRGRNGGLGQEPAPRLLDRSDPGAAPPDEPWWREVQPWPPGVLFEDGPCEEVIDQGPLPWPIFAGLIGCASGWAADSRFAEPEIDGISA